jgi:C-terminal processing protease CtpA/Prc
LMMITIQKHLLAGLAIAGLLGGSIVAADPTAPAPGPATGEKKAADNNNAPKPSIPAPAANDSSKPQAPTAPKPSAPPAADEAKDSPAPQPPAGPKPDQPAPTATDNKQARDADRPDQRNADRNPAQRNDRDQNPQADRDDRRRDDSSPARNSANNTDARPNAQGAIRHQTNRALSNDAASQRTGRESANVDGQGRANVRGNAANLGLAFGAAAGANSPLVISSIGPRGYFANAGFQQGDQIVSVGGRRFNNQAGFYSYLDGLQVGQRIPFVVLRNGQQQTVNWTPTQEFVQEFAQAAPINSANSFLGIHLDDQVNDAAVVADVDRNSPADQAGVRPEDVIVAVNGQQVSNPDDFSRAVANVSEGSPVALNVSRMLALNIGQNAPVQQTGSVPPAPNATNVAPAPQGTVTPAPVAPAPTRTRGGLFRRAR